MDMGHVLLEARVVIKLTDQDINDIVNAITDQDSDVTQWCDQININNARPIVHGGTITFRDRDTGMVFDLTQEKLVNGIRMWVEDGGIIEVDRGKDGVYKINPCAIDGHQANNILKFSLFSIVASSKEG